jgi:hypothetical protein
MGSMGQLSEVAQIALWAGSWPLRMEVPIGPAPEGGGHRIIYALLFCKRHASHNGPDRHTENRGGVKNAMRHAESERR